MSLSHRARALRGGGGFFIAQFTALIAALGILSAPVEGQASEPLFNLFASGRAGAGYLTFDGHGNLFMSNAKDNTIGKVTSAGKVSTFAKGLSSPTQLAFDSRGDLYVVNASKNSISKITPDGHVTDVAAVNERVSVCPNIPTICTYYVASPAGLAFDPAARFTCRHRTPALSTVSRRMELPRILSSARRPTVYLSLRMGAFTRPGDLVSPGSCPMVKPVRW